MEHIYTKPRIEIIPFITHHRFHTKALCEKILNIPVGDPVYCVKGVLALPTGDLICLRDSENAKKHFAINADGRGMERGEITHHLAYSPRKRMSANGNIYRFSDLESQLIFFNYGNWIKKGLDHIVFNTAFFEADVDKLKQLAIQLHMDEPFQTKKDENLFKENILPSQKLTDD